MTYKDMSSGTVLILLSTYNAEKYLIEQLESLRMQTYPNIKVIIRDDGSKDNTLSMLEKFCTKHETFSYYQGENLGAKGSFFNLIKNAKDEICEYYALCDQDDVWEKDKVEKAVSTIRNIQYNHDERLPLLYCSTTKLVDANLNQLPNQISHNKKPSFYNSLIENIVTGCTTLMNHDMYEIMLKHIPNYCIMHDWWMYLLATYYGYLIYDRQSYILYRQHGDNVMGIDGKYSTELKNRTKKFKGRKSNISNQAAVFCRNCKKTDFNIATPDFSNLDSSRYAISSKIDHVKGYSVAQELSEYKNSLKSRMTIAFENKIFRQRKLDEIIFRVLFLLGLR